MTTQTTSLTRLTKPVLVEKVANLTRSVEEASEKQLAAAVLGVLGGLLLGAALF